MTGLPIWCPPCGTTTQHDAGGDLVRCRVCGHTRPNDVPLLISQVQDMSGFCPWCNERKPADHTCPAGAVGCSEREPGDYPCGVCPRCQQTQLDDYARRDHIEHGSPSDLDGGAA